MNDNNKELQPPIGAAALDKSREHLSFTISTLRSWAACPLMFDSISASDRQNLFLAVLDQAESAQAMLSQPS